MQANKLVILLIAISLSSKVQAVDSSLAEETVGTNSFSVEQSEDGSGASSTYISLGFGLSKHSSLDLSYVAASDTSASLGLSWNRSSESGWSALAYEFSGELGNVEAHSFTAELGIKRQSWSASIIPRFNSIRVYTQFQPSKSVALNSPGLAASYTYHARDWDYGLESGVNFYTKRLDTYATNSRLLLLFDPAALQLVSGLEKSYLLANATRFQEWGEWGVQAVNSISAVDFSSSQSVGSHIRFYLGKSWDLTLAYTQSRYQQSNSSRYSLALSSFW